MSKKRLLPWLFSLFVLLAQQGLWLHAFSHHDAAPGTTPQCEQCLAFAAIAAAAPTFHAPDVAGAAGPNDYVAPPQQFVFAQSSRAFFARAPPLAS